MIGRNIQRFAAVRTLVLAALLPTGLLGNTPIPLLAQASGTWTNTGSPNTARTAHTATLLGTGQVLIAGGSSSAGLLASAELYNPVTGKWTHSPWDHPRPGAPLIAALCDEWVLRRGIPLGVGCASSAIKI